MTDAIMEIGKGDPTKALRFLLESVEIIADALAERDDKRRAANSGTRSLPIGTSKTIKSPGYYYGGGGCTLPLNWGLT